MIYMTKAGMFCCKKDKNTRIVAKEKMRNFDNTIIYVRTGEKKLKCQILDITELCKNRKNLKSIRHIYTQGLKDALKIKKYPLFLFIS